MDDNSRNKLRHIIHVAAGLYLLYTAYSLFQGLAEMSGNEKIIMIIAIIAFTVIGAGLTVLGVKQGLKESRVETDAGDDALAEGGEGIDEEEGQDGSR